MATPIDLLGRSLTDIDWTELGLDRPATEEIDGRVYAEFPHHGFDLVADAAGTVTTVHLCSARLDGYTEYRWELPAGIAFGNDREELLDRLGDPTRSGEARVIQPFGNTPAWDLWRLGSTTVHCRYPPGGVDLVSVALDEKSHEAS
ncbi:hypothetical protein [Actinospongicola halichondriae]|uniref:hypothetical protein n=1 Tax=Actinospongicola halichondriae TaxID=3236844 RepID=UPI003D383D74